MQAGCKSPKKCTPTYSKPTSPAMVPSKSFGFARNGRAFDISLPSFLSGGCPQRSFCSCDCDLATFLEEGTKAEEPTARTQERETESFMVKKMFVAFTEGWTTRRWISIFVRKFCTLSCGLRVEQTSSDADSDEMAQYHSDCVISGW
jgi:hypothetical protein